MSVRPDEHSPRAAGRLPDRPRVAFGAGLLVVVLMLTLIVANRTGSEAPEAGAVPAGSIVSQPGPAGEADRVGPASPRDAGDRAELAGRTRRLDSAIGIPPIEDGLRPVAISFAAIGVDEAPVDGVGVEANGELEVPAPTRVGWYRYGPSPGERGSAVLAAHIASAGVDGVFRYLSEVSVGEQFEITFDDGTSARYRIAELSQYDKDDLPIDRVFARDGAPIVTLITCGGAFQPSVRSYEDNVVAYAVPVEST